jgi:hypothetical protein
MLVGRPNRLNFRSWTRSRLSRMAASVPGDDRQILFMLSERYESQAAYQIRCRGLALTLTLVGKDALLTTVPLRVASSRGARSEFRFGD